MRSRQSSSGGVDNGIEQCSYAERAACTKFRSRSTSRGDAHQGGWVSRTSHAGMFEGLFEEEEAAAQRHERMLGGHILYILTASAI